MLIHMHLYMSRFLYVFFQLVIFQNDHRRIRMDSTANDNAIVEDKAEKEA